MQKALIPLLLLLAAAAAPGATYYSQGSLAPNDLSSWNSIRTGGGSQPADFISGDAFVVQGGHVMTTSGTWGISGTGSMVQIEAGGTLSSTSAITLSAATSFQIDGGGTYKHGNASAYGTTIFQGAESFAANSTVELNNSNTTGPSGVTFGSLVVNFTSDPGGSVNCAGGLTAINGSLTVQSTYDREFQLSGNTPYALSIAGDLLISGGTLNASSGSDPDLSFTVTCSGDYSQSGGTFTHGNASSPLDFIFSGPASAFSNSGGTIDGANIDWEVSASDTLTLNSDLGVSSGRTFTVNGFLDCAGENAITGAGGFVLNAGATLGVGSEYGISDWDRLYGNILTYPNLSFDPGANYVFNNHPLAGASSFGSDMPTTMNDITINLTNGADVIFPESADFIINGTLNMLRGLFNAFYLNLTICNPITNNRNDLITTDPPTTNITIAGTGSNIVLPSSLDTLGSLTVNNANGLTLETDLTIVDSLKMVSGVLPTGADTVFLSPTALIFEGADSYVQGDVRTTRYLYQYVNETFGGLGVEIQADGGEPGATTVTRVTGTPIVQGSVSSIDRYFHISPENNTGLSATMAFHYREGELNGIVESNLALFRSSDFERWGIYGGGGSVNATDDTVTVTGVDSFSWWTLGDRTNPLPVQLSSLSALASEGAIVITWRTESENGSYLWLVERSDHEHGPFSELGRLPAAGQSQAPRDYSWTDRTARAGDTYYYRIGELSQDGRTTYYGPVSCGLGRGLPQVDLALGCAPNPFRSFTEIRYQVAKASPVSVSIYNVSGQLTRKLDLGLVQPGYHRAAWDGTDRIGRRLSVGIYLYRISIGGRQFGGKVQLVR